MAFYLKSERPADGVVYWHLWDEGGCTVDAAFDHLLELVDHKGDRPSTVEGRAYALKKWYSFLQTEKTTDIDATDDTLLKFRKSLMSRSAPNRSDDEQAHKRSVNKDLRRIYKFYVWLQTQEHYSKGKRIIGTHGCQITSTLVQSQLPAIKRTSRSDYPKIFHDAGEHSRHRSSHVLDEGDRSALHEYFHAHCSEEIALRNCLIFDLAWEVGLRRASILSLTISDFDSARSTTAADFISVCPRRQKFGYSNRFPVPIHLAARIVRYIDGERAELIAATGSDAREVFLSSADGGPLSGKGVTVDFYRAARSVGLPRRSGLHCGRHSFAHSFVRKELAARRELGLDTSADSVALALAEALGHESINSQIAYLSNLGSLMRQSEVFRSAMHNAKLANENAELRAALYYEKRQRTSAQQTQGC
jgi:site-specific recombinase XerD